MAEASLRPLRVWSTPSRRAAYGCYWRWMCRLCGRFTKDLIPLPGQAHNDALGHLAVAHHEWVACPWPWPTADGHVRLDCPHYTASASAARRQNTRIGCQRYESGTWVHGDPHDCPPYVRGR